MTSGELTRANARNPRARLGNVARLWSQNLERNCGKKDPKISQTEATKWL